MQQDKLITLAAELQSIAQAGLFYGKDVFDKERYTRVREISAEILAMKTELPLDTVKNLFCADYGYQHLKLIPVAPYLKTAKYYLYGKITVPGRAGRLVRI